MKSKRVILKRERNFSVYLFNEVDPPYSMLPVVVPFHELAPTFISLI